jgi:hypothetical protein
MIVQAIVALLQQAPAIDRATVRSCFLYRAAADNFFSGFRRLQCHAAEKSGGPKFCLPQYFGRLIGGLLFRGTGSARGRRKNISKGGPAARRGLYCCHLLPHHPHSRRHPARNQYRRPVARLHRPCKVFNR